MKKATTIVVKNNIEKSDDEQDKFSWAHPNAGL